MKLLEQVDEIWTLLDEIEKIKPIRPRNQYLYDRVRSLCQRIRAEWKDSGGSQAFVPD